MTSNGQGDVDSKSDKNIKTMKQQTYNNIAIICSYIGTNEMVYDNNLYMYSCTRMCIYVYICVCMYVCMYVYVYTSTGTLHVIPSINHVKHTSEALREKKQNGIQLECTV